MLAIKTEKPVLHAVQCPDCLVESRGDWRRVIALHTNLNKVATRRLVVAIFQILFEFFRRRNRIYSSFFAAKYCRKKVVTPLSKIIVIEFPIFHKRR